jgi:hypothetical protein
MNDYKGVILMCVHGRKDDKQISQGEVMTENKGS